jgi:CBS domain-containing protein
MIISAVSGKDCGKKRSFLVKPRFHPADKGLSKPKRKPMPPTHSDNVCSVKPQAPVVTVYQHQRVVEAAQIMQDHHVGCLVVNDVQEKMVGILSERDILQWVANASPTSFRQKVQDIMTPNVVHVSPQTPACDCRQLMSQNNIRHLPIVENGRAVGMLSIRDIMEQ